MATSLGFTAFIALAFSFLRPYNQAVYAPKLKHADEKHAPPPLGRQPWSWITPLLNTREEVLMHQIGMDATIFLRFVRMCRNIFLVLAVLGIGILVPVHMYGTEIDKVAGNDNKWILLITPLSLSNQKSMWAQVAVAWLSEIIIAAFLWWNYRKVLQLRRKYFESEDFQNSLHSRTLLVRSSHRLA